MNGKIPSRILMLVLALALLAVLAGCQPAATPSQQSADPTNASAEQPSPGSPVNGTNAPAPAEPTRPPV